MVLNLEIMKLRSSLAVTMGSNLREKKSFLALAAAVSKVQRSTVAVAIFW